MVEKLYKSFIIYRRYFDNKIRAFKDLLIIVELQYVSSGHRRTVKGFLALKNFQNFFYNVNWS